MFAGSRTSKNWTQPVTRVPGRSQFGISEKKSLANARILPLVGTSSFSHETFGRITPSLCGLAGLEMS